MSYMYGIFLGELQLADHAHPQNRLHKFTENDIATDWMALTEWVHGPVVDCLKLKFLAEQIKMENTLKETL